MKSLAMLVLVAACAPAAKPAAPIGNTKITHPVALALVILGAEVWVGNDDFEAEDSPARYPGALKGLAHSLDAAKLAAATAPGSRAELVSYSDKVEVRLPMGPIAALTGAKLGTQKDYYRRTGESMVAGVTRGIADLEREPIAYKVLIVVGDGNDVDAASAKPALAELARRAAADRIDVFAVIYKGPLSDPANLVTILDPHAVTIMSPEAFEGELRRIASRFH